MTSDGFRKSELSAKKRVPRSVGRLSLQSPATVKSEFQLPHTSRHSHCTRCPCLSHQFSTHCHRMSFTRARQCGTRPAIRPPAVGQEDCTRWSAPESGRHAGQRRKEPLDGGAVVLPNVGCWGVTAHAPDFPCRLTRGCQIPSKDEGTETRGVRTGILWALRNASTTASASAQSSGR